MAEQQRRVNNQLFSVSVTGGTFEEFSQHAMLYPAQQSLATTPEPSHTTPTPPQQELIPLPTVSSDYQNQEQLHPNIFSSFSNVLNLGHSTPSEFSNAAPPPPQVAGVDTPAPVPLFSPEIQSQLHHQAPSKPPQSSQGSTNTYRRVGSKRPQYAQPPGLAGGQQLLQPPLQSSHRPTEPSVVTAGLPEESQLPVFLNPVTSVPQFSTWSSSNTPPVNFFTPSTMATTSAVEAPMISSTPVSTPQQYNAYGGEGNVLPTPTAENAPTQTYRPVYHHWFYKQEIEGKVLWKPFSMVDSLALEAAFTSTDLTPETTVPTDGGRYDVNILRRQRSPVYWEGKTTEVRRCSWFQKGSSDGRYTPYEENVATRLEEEFKIAFDTNQWHRKVEIDSGDTVVFHSPDVLVLFPQSQVPDAWGNTPNQTRTRIVKRGMDVFDIDEGEPEKVDHLLFLVHGIGSVCDLKFRTVEEVVDDFRQISLQLVRSHYRTSCEHGRVNRIEVLPISWHNQLHSESTGIDKKLKSITLESIPRLRDFTNDTLLDILFYTSPCYCQTIINTVGCEINRVYDLFKQRNPEFKGQVSLGGHSLGSLILFDLLCHQHPEQPEEQNDKTGEDDDDIVTPLKPPPLRRRMSRRISYMMTASGTGQPQLHYPQLDFQPKAFFALGSPIGMFVTVRGLDTLGEQFELPTCPYFFNIFHPYDPVAYRIESLINPQLASLKPVLIPHHKGRKRMHLELKETVVRVGTDLKQRIKESVKNTLNSFYLLTKFSQNNTQQPTLVEEEVDRVLESEITRKANDDVQEEVEQQQTDLPLGLLNKGRRIDYVLQEAPFEFFNEYIFALSSHVCYWESEDTMLLILKEIYGSMNVQPDNQIPQQTMTIERPPPSPKHARAPAVPRNQGKVGMDPTAPIAQNASLGPPPTSGFVRKT